VGAGALVIGAGVSWSALAVMIVLVALAAVTLRSGTGELRRHSFEIEQTPALPPRTTARGRRSLVGVLDRELRSSTSIFLLQKTALAIALALAFLVDFRLGGSDLLPIDAGEQLVTRIALFMTFIASLTATEVVLNVCGPVTLRNQLRYAWDCGAPVPRMLPAAVSYWILPGLLIAIAGADAHLRQPDVRDPDPGHLAARRRAGVAGDDVGDVVGPLRDAAAYLPYAAGQALSSTPRAGAGSLYSGAHAASPAIAALAFIG
jgi:hypothetical protein